MNENIQICNKLTASKWRCLFPTKMDGHIVIIYTEAVVGRCSLKKVFLKFRIFHWKTPVFESLFNKVAGFRLATFLKRGFSIGVFL